MESKINFEFKKRLLFLYIKVYERDGRKIREIYSMNYTLNWTHFSVSDVKQKKTFQLTIILTFYIKNKSLFLFSEILIYLQHKIIKNMKLLSNRENNIFLLQSKTIENQSGTGFF